VPLPISFQAVVGPRPDKSQKVEIVMVIGAWPVVAPSWFVVVGMSPLLCGTARHCSHSSLGVFHPLIADSDFFFSRRRRSTSLMSLTVST
jgi:hypothetical protein